MASLNNFNANEVEPATDFEPLPEGRYEAMITKSEEISNANSNGSHLKLTFTVISGQYVNRTLFHRLNLQNDSPQAVKIARAQLSAICRAVRIMQPKDSVDLHNLPVIVNVKQEPYTKSTGEASISNKITSFSSCENATKKVDHIDQEQQIPKKSPWGKV